MSGVGHNSDSYRVVSGELRAFVERVENLRAEKRELSDQEREVLMEAKGRGYDVRTIRKLVAERKMKPHVLAEQQAVLEMYREALSMLE